MKWLALNLNDIGEREALVPANSNNEIAGNCRWNEKGKKTVQLGQSLIADNRFIRIDA